MLYAVSPSMRHSPYVDKYLSSIHWECVCTILNLTNRESSGRLPSKEYLPSIQNHGHRVVYRNLRRSLHNRNQKPLCFITEPQPKLIRYLRVKPLASVCISQIPSFEYCFHGSGNKCLRFCCSYFKSCGYRLLYKTNNNCTCSPFTNMV